MRDFHLETFRIVYKRRMKSLAMKNFIFKSKTEASDLFKIFTILKMVQTELRHQRSDLAEIKRSLNEPAVFGPKGERIEMGALDGDSNPELGE